MTNANLINGRRALVGKSSVLRVDTGDTTTMPPQSGGDLQVAGLKSFYVAQLGVFTIKIEGPGSVSRSPEKPRYEPGELVTLTATPGRWHAFSHWREGPTDNPRIVSVAEPNLYFAVFTATQALETLTFGGVTRVAPVGTPAVFVDGQFVAEGNINRWAPAQITMSTTYTNGVIFYTLDGSEPSPTDLTYTGPFAVTASATIRALAFNASFTQSNQADPVRVHFLPLHASTKGGGTVTVNLLSNETATVTASPAPGWTFLQWLGDTTGSNPVVHLTMDRPHCVQAIFGTPLNFVESGSGFITPEPLLSLYPYGTLVRSTAWPSIGNYFVQWGRGNVVSSSHNPLESVVTNAGTTLTAVFQPLALYESALVVIHQGEGTVNVGPDANHYDLGSSVMLTAVPKPGQSFLGWSGGAEGTENPLVVSMSEMRRIAAFFTTRPRLSYENCFGSNTTEAFRLLLTGEFGAVYNIEASTDLTHWTPLVTLTNSLGTSQFDDASAASFPQRFYRAVLFLP